MIIRKATLADIPGILSLASESPSAAQWSAQQYREMFSSAHTGERLAMVSVADSEGPPDMGRAYKAVLGFLVARHLAPEWEIENVVVSLSSRRKGIGTQLLDRLLAIARETKSEAVFLEVRESNASARALYERSGFQQHGRRKSYYSNPIEDAILFRLSLG